MLLINTVVCVVGKNIVRKFTQVGGKLRPSPGTEFLPVAGESTRWITEQSEANYTWESH